MRGKTVKLITEGSIKRPSLCIVNDSNKRRKNNERQAESKEKQVRKIARKKTTENKKENREYRNKKENGEYRKTERIKSEVKKQECDRGMHQ